MRFTRHAAERMVERGISELEVEQALSHPIGQREYRRGLATVRGRAGRRTLRIVMDVERDLVITVEF